MLTTSMGDGPVTPVRMSHEGVSVFEIEYVFICVYCT
jgi:hypothetical protein